MSRTAAALALILLACEPGARDSRPRGADDEAGSSTGGGGSADASGGGAVSTGGIGGGSAGTAGIGGTGAEDAADAAAGAAGDAGADGGASGSDAGTMLDAGACDLSLFAEAVRAARSLRPTGTHTCASPLPIMMVANAAEARDVIRTFVADVTGVAAASFDVDEVECATPGTVACARHFQHDVYKSNGFLGEDLYPLAEQLERCASEIEETIWVAMVDNVRRGAVVCISGLWNDQLAGIAFFNEQDACP